MIKECNQQRRTARREARAERHVQSAFAAAVELSPAEPEQTHAEIMRAASAVAVAVAIAVELDPDQPA